MDIGPVLGADMGRTKVEQRLDMEWVGGGHGVDIRRTLGGHWGQWGLPGPEGQSGPIKVQ